MKKYISSVVRHLLTGLGATLVALGVEHQDAQSFLLASEPVITGLAVYALGQGWSFINVSAIKTLAAKWGLKI